MSVRDLVKYYPIHAGVLRRHVGDVRAVDGVSMDIRKGEILGLVGESGCGKSTLGKTLLQLLPATRGRVLLDGQDVLGRTGRDLKRLRRRMQIVFQDPVSSLNPRMPVSDIIGEGLIAQADRENRWSDSAVREKRVGDYLEVVGLRRDYARRFPHEFSGGQRQRIGIARALALEPEFVVCDEPVSALDVSIQSQILNLLGDLRREFGLTYLFVAHNLSVVQYISDRVGVMYLGKLVELAPVERLYEDPRHPYTVALLSAVPIPDPRHAAPSGSCSRGTMPSPAAPPSGCQFPSPLLAAGAARQSRALRDRGCRCAPWARATIWPPVTSPSGSARGAREAVAEQPEIVASDALEADGHDPTPPEHVVDGGPDD
ncbi:MAG: ATP-binding cassette domain-containing protein [Chloroflexota bacterium]